MDKNSRTVTVALAVCSYKGPDLHCYCSHYDVLHYFGRLQERSHWAYHHPVPGDSIPLEPNGNPEAEWKFGDPRFRFGFTDEAGNSLIGQARDRCIKNAQKTGCDYILFWDDDLIFARSAFLKLWRHQLPIVSGLAFTAREPVAPVLYRFKRDFSFDKRIEKVDIEPIWDYQKDTLNRVDATGTGLILIDMSVFERLPEPWFHGSVNCGEDIHFSFKCHQQGIPIHCDTSVKTCHRPNRPEDWMDELYYERSRGQIANGSDPDVQQRQAATGLPKIIQCVG